MASSPPAKPVREGFEGDYTIAFNLAPPLLARRDKGTNRPFKRRFGPWMQNGFALMARMRPLRGTPLDIFGYGQHRRTERQLVRDYAALVEDVIRDLTPANTAAAEAVLRAHDKVRGYDVVKEASIARVRAGLPALVAAMRA